MFFQKKIWITMLSLRVQNFNAKKKEKHLSGQIFFVIKDYSTWKLFLNGLVKTVKGVTQQCWKKLFLRKQGVHGKFFTWNFFLNDSSISESTNDGRIRIHFYSGPFSQKNTLKMKKFFGGFGLNYERGTEERYWLKKPKIRRNSLSEKLFSWKVFLKDTVIFGSTEDRCWKKKFFFIVIF